MRTDEMMDLKNLSRDDVQAALAAMASKSDAIALMKEHGGVDALADLPESRFAAVVQAAHAAVAAGGGKGKPFAKGSATQPKLDPKQIWNRFNNPPKRQSE